MDVKKIFSPKSICDYFKYNVFYSNRKVSYAQSGEDIIVDYIFNNWLNIPNPSYLDIGTNDPLVMNNTYFFYKKKCNGVCIEPDPVLYKKICKKRKRDVCLNIGISKDQYELADYYILTSKTLNTFSKEYAEHCQQFNNQKIENVIKIPLVPINNIIKQYFEIKPNFISLDIEGNELEILSAFDFSQHKPEVFCIETISYADYVKNKSITKNIAIIDFMKSNDYLVYGDTCMNTIFLSRQALEKAHYNMVE